MMLSEDIQRSQRFVPSEHQHNAKAASDTRDISPLSSMGRGDFHCRSPRQHEKEEKQCHCKLARQKIPIKLCVYVIMQACNGILIGKTKNSNSTEANETNTRRESTRVGATSVSGSSRSKPASNGVKRCKGEPLAEEGHATVRHARIAFVELPLKSRLYSDDNESAWTVSGPDEREKSYGIRTWAFVCNTTTTTPPPPPTTTATTAATLLPLLTK